VGVTFGWRGVHSLRSVPCKMSRIPVFKKGVFEVMGRLERHPPSSSRFRLFFPKSQFPKLVAI